MLLTVTAIMVPYLYSEVRTVRSRRECPAREGSMAKTWETPQMVQETGFRWSRVVVYGLLVFFAAVYLLPLLVMLLTSFKPLPEIYAGNMVALPRHWTVEPWVNAWTKACVG